MHAYLTSDSLSIYKKIEDPILFFFMISEHFIIVITLHFTLMGKKMKYVSVIL